MDGQAGVYTGGCIHPAPSVYLCALQGSAPYPMVAPSSAPCVVLGRGDIPADKLRSGSLDEAWPWAEALGLKSYKAK